MTDRTQKFRVTANALAIVGSAAFAGAALLILLSYGARWLNTDPLVWRAGFWAEFLNFAITIIPLNLVALTGLVLSARSDWQDKPVRRLWMIALGLFVANSVFTLAYFIPQNILLISDNYSSTEAAHIRATWLGLHSLRVVIAAAVPVFALFAVLQSMERPST